MQTIFNSPDQWNSRFVTADGYQTHYIEAGASNPERVVMCHGGANEIGMGNYRWYPNIVPLGERLHVYAIDELGHGQTDPPRNLDDLGHVRVRAEHVIRFIEALELAPVNLVGQSQGGWIVTYITIKRPDLVKKLVLIDSGSAAGSGIPKTGEGRQVIEVDGQEVEVDGSGELPYFKDVFEPGTMTFKEGIATTREGLRTLAQTTLYHKDRVAEEYLDHLTELSARWNGLYTKHMGKEYWEKNGMAGASEMYYFDGAHMRDHVHKISVPTLVIWGRNSNKGLDPGFDLYKRIPNAQMHILDKADHFVWVDQPEDFNSLVTWFLGKE
jgi:pimeloyl-ACP methyl ester carboxylesterase